jgi:hypothetical protein
MTLATGHQPLATTHQPLIDPAPQGFVPGSINRKSRASDTKNDLKRNSETNDNQTPNRNRRISIKHQISKRSGDPPPEDEIALINPRFVRD